MAQKPRELGERQHEDRRTGVGGFVGWKGIVREGNPSSIPDDSLWNAENVRLSGKILVSRGGQVKVNTGAISAIQGFYDATDIGAPVIPVPPGPGGRYVYLSALKADGSTRSIIRFDTQLLTLDEVQIGTTYDGINPYYATFGLLAGSADGALYTWGSIRNPTTVQDTPLVLKITGFPSLTLTTIFSLTPSAEIDGAFFNSPSFTEFGTIEDPSTAGTFYASLQGPTTDGSIPQTAAVYRAGVLDDTTSFVYSTATSTLYAFMQSFNSTVYAAWGSTTPGGGKSDTIRKRVASTNWTNLTLPAPPIALGRYGASDRPVVFSSKLWIPGVWNTPATSNLQAEILSVTTGDVVTRERALGAVTTGTAYVGTLTVFNSKLYYLWFHDVSANPGSMGKYNGSVWTDHEWDGMVSGTQYTPQLICPAETGATTLYCYAIKASDSTVWILKSNGTDTTTWSVVTQISSGSTPFRAAMVASDS